MYLYLCVHNIQGTVTVVFFKKIVRNQDSDFLFCLILDTSTSTQVGTAAAVRDNYLLYVYSAVPVRDIPYI